LLKAQEKNGFLSTSDSKEYQLDITHLLCLREAELDL